MENQQEPLVLLITDSERISEQVPQFLTEHYRVQTAFQIDELEIKEWKEFYEFVIVDFLLLKNFETRPLEADFYQEKYQYLSGLFPDSSLIVFSDHRRMEEASTLIELGFDDVLQLPLTKDLLLHRLNQREEKVHLAKALTHSLGNQKLTHQLFDTKNESFKKVISKVELVAPTLSTILITGESGTGKSLLAKYIHALSKRKQDAFIDVHCGAIPENLVESELFGHEKGSFTGAIKRKVGKFEMADKGTIFLDEIGTVSKSVQVRLLQVLQERFIQRVGGESNIPLDLRIIAATNENLKTMVQSQDFREDLFYRLNVFQVEIPPLRERIEDIPHLCQGFITKYNALYSKEIKGISPEVRTIFSAYHWPGNIRELENLIERACILEQSQEITTENIPADLIGANREILSISPLERKKITLADARKEATDAFEKKYLTDLLIQHHGKVSSMAEEAEVTVRQLHKLLARHEINPKKFSHGKLEN